jgi:hypothetical protein
MRSYSVSQIFFKIFFFKEKMWGSLKSQGVAVQLPQRTGLGDGLEIYNIKPGAKAKYFY